MNLILVSEVELTITSDTAEIKLTGTFDQSKAIFEGTFSCSQNLKAAWLTDRKDGDKNRFKLMGHECQNRAVRLAASTDMDDARFTSFKDPITGLEKFGAIGNLRLSKDGRNTGYKRATVDFMDLNDKTMESKSI